MLEVINCCKAKRFGILNKAIYIDNLNKQNATFTIKTRATSRVCSTNINNNKKNPDTYFAGSKKPKRQQ